MEGINTNFEALESYVNSEFEEAKLLFRQMYAFYGNSKFCVTKIPENMAYKSKPGMRPVISPNLQQAIARRLNKKLSQWCREHNITVIDYDFTQLKPDKLHLSRNSGQNLCSNIQAWMDQESRPRYRTRVILYNYIMCFIF